MCEPRAVKTTQELDDAVITAGHVVNPVSKAAEQLGTRLRSLEAMTRTVRFDVSVGDDVGPEPVAVLCDVSQRPEEQGKQAVATYTSQASFSEARTWQMKCTFELKGRHDTRRGNSDAKLFQMECGTC